MEIEDIKITPKKHTGWGARHTLGILGFWGFAMSYSMRFNISIAIVSMVNQTYLLEHAKSTAGKSHEPADDALACRELAMEQANSTTGDSHEQDGEFKWDHFEQGVILSSFFWGYVLTQMPGGVLSHRYGGKWPMGLGLLFAGIATVFTPLAARTHKYLLCFTRVICGLGEGFAFPCAHSLISTWSPQDEKSKMGSFIFAGAQFGTAATMIMSGYLIHGGVFGGWPAVFYVIGSLTILWFVFWTFFVFDRPSEHPRISVEELNYIESSIGNQASKVRMPTPWKAIFTSLPFWAIMMGHIGHAWGLYTLLHELPSYLRNVLHFDIRQNSWLSALPYILMWIASIFLTQIADTLISKNIVRTVVVRKSCQAIAHIGSAILLIAASYSGCDRSTTVALLTLSVAINGAIYGGYVVNHVDIARNFAGVLSGITHTVANFTGFSVPIVAGAILSQNPSLENWQYVFFIAAAVYVFDVVFYVIFGSASEQPWNRGYESTTK